MSTNKCISIWYPLSSYTVNISSNIYNKKPNWKQAWSSSKVIWLLRLWWLVLRQTQELPLKWRKTSPPKMYSLRSKKMFLAKAVWTTCNIVWHLWMKNVQVQCQLQSHPDPWSQFQVAQLGQAYHLAWGFCRTSCSTSPSIWYKIIGTGGLITVDTCNSASYDTKIHIYSGSCGSPVCVTGNDNGIGCAGFTSFTSFSSVLGTEYFIHVFGFLSASGDFDLNIVSAELPPCNRTAIVGLSPATPVTVSGSTLGGGASRPTVPFCGTSYYAIYVAWVMRFSQLALDWQISWTRNSHFCAHKNFDKINNNNQPTMVLSERNNYPFQSVFILQITIIRYLQLTTEERTKIWPQEVAIWQPTQTTWKLASNGTRWQQWWYDAR